MEHLKLAFDLCNIKMAKDEPYTFEGYASVFNGDDDVGDTILKGAFLQTIENNKKPVGFFNHKHDTVPICKWLELREDDRGLWVKGELTKGIILAEDIRLAMLAETIDGLSIGFTKLVQGVDYDAKANGGRVIRNIPNMPEISIVGFPCDGDARITLDTVKSSLETFDTLKDFELLLRDSANFSKKAATLFVANVRNLKQRDAGIEQVQKDKELQSLTNLLTNFKL